ncbi:glycosyltransferase [Desulfurivibrio dismutans]|uniref:glycosyltransferase n=1 Tax=Desulfurivibrio dismutans TaxID=1398908 RepID=UPI0023DC132C|nr:glycosyltransferase [Desulfurivibrio alkaliphilus]MDF1615769.1 glycosyltransferase [Desulfurivibrio alkaliphilus]
MKEMLAAYAEVVGQDVIAHLQQLSLPLQGMKVVHVNSTRVGGGVAEILEKLVPLSNELGIDTSWEVISGNDEFYRCTKAMHNGLQGHRGPIADSLLRAYEEANRENAEKLREQLEAADFVFIHDPQPAPLLGLCPNRRGRWIWRCHIDASRPYRPLWRYLRDHIAPYDASVFSLPDFAQALPHPEYIIPPSIDPLSDKNIELPTAEIDRVRKEFDLDPERPMVLQVSRFDRFKDPVGVIEAHRLARKFVPGLQLVLAGGTATDDPEGEVVLQDVRRAAGDDPDVKVLLLPPDAHRTINALQRAADIVIQKSTKEGFGLTVTEGLWKGKPVIGGDTGGIRLQVVNYQTGFLVRTPQGAALRIRYLLYRRDRMAEMGEKARQFVRENFLLTRHLREYLALIVGLLHQAEYRIEL